MGCFDEMNEQFEQNDAENSVFFKIEDGHSVLGVFVGKPFIRSVYWQEGGGYQPWEEGCGKGKTLLTSMNFAVVKMVDKKPVFQGLQLCEQSKTFFKDVSKLDTKYGIDNKVFEISREGVKKDTKYTILPECDITPELRKVLDGLTLFDLEASSTSESPVKMGESGTPKDDSSGPEEMVDKAVADALIDDLKALSEWRAEIVNEFLAEFKIRKIRELPASMKDSARTWVDSELEGMRHGKADEEPGTADPFA